jgi:DNA-binding winged helix-turn-helix (wHTH) protein
MTMRATSSVRRSVRIRFDCFELDEDDARLTRDGNAVPLAPRTFAVLCELARTPQSLVTKNALLDAVWGHRFVSDSALKSAISSLRTALGDDAKCPDGGQRAGGVEAFGRPRVVAHRTTDRER